MKRKFQRGGHIGFKRGQTPLPPLMKPCILYYDVRYTCIVHPESFRSNSQNAIAFARRNRPRVDRNDEFACVYLRLRACVCVRLQVLFAIDRVCVRALRTRAHTYIHVGKVWAWHYLRSLYIHAYASLA